MEDAKENYFGLKEEADKCDMRIEEAMLSFEQGQIDVERVQQISKQGVHVKYKAELASQAYNQSVN